MKKIIPFLFLFLSVCGASAQNKDAVYKNIIDRITIGYNKGEYKSVYAMFSPDFKQKISEAEFNTFLTDVSVYGKIKSTEYSHDKDGFKVYKAQMDKGLLSLIVSCNELALVNGFAIVPYKAPAPKVLIPILTDNKKVTALDLEVDKAVADFMQNPSNPGLSIAVIKDGQTFIYQYGESKKGSGKLPAASTIYEIGSITKTFTGILLAKALEDKKLSLYDDVRKFLPVKCSDLAFGNHPVILKHLANHTSGIPRIPENLDQQPYYDPMNPYKSYDKEMLHDYLSTLQLKTTPGIVQEYSNTGMALLGQIVAETYALDYEKLVNAYIAKPLKMASTFVAVPDKMKDKFVNGYYQGAQTAAWDFADTPGAGGLKSTIGDMALYLQANIDNTIPYIKFSHEPTYKNNDESTALGWFILKTDTGTTMIWHNGGTYGFSSFMGYIKEKKCGVVLLGNSFTNGELDSIGTAILKFMQK